LIILLDKQVATEWRRCHDKNRSNFPQNQQNAAAGPDRIIKTHIPKSDFTKSIQLTLVSKTQKP